MEPNPTDNYDDIVRKVEDCARQLLLTVQSFLDKLRTLKEQSVETVQPTWRQSQQQQNTTDTEPCIDLLWMEDVAVNVELLVAEIESTIPLTANANHTWDLSEYRIDSTQEDKGEEHEAWTRAFHQITIPLLVGLGRCYAFFDDLPQSCALKTKVNSKGDGKKPTPPPGMLSIQNYMDVASLLEFAVCVRIAPFLDEHVLPPLENRLQTVPRTMRGRLPMGAIRTAARSITGNAAQDLRNSNQQRYRELVCTASLVGNLISLERFRPMLLPRHLADVYAAIFQAEQLSQTLDESSILSPFDRLREELLDFDRVTLTQAKLAARAFQTLLLQGRKGPLWLRKRVSLLLNHLATIQLEAVIDVFVHSAPNDKTGAAARLARALTMDKTDQDYLSRLARQFFVILDTTIMLRFSNDRKDAENPDAATIAFLWMAMEQLPDEILTRTFFQSFSQSFLMTHHPNSQPHAPNKMGDECVSLHHTVLRMNRLLVAAPPAANYKRFCKLVLLRPIGPGDTNIFGLLLRLSCAPSIFQDPVKEDALSSLRAAVELIARSSFVVDGETMPISGIDVAVVSMVYSLVPSKWDLEGMSFRFQTSADSPSKGPLSRVVVERRRNASNVETTMGNVDDIQRHAEYVVREVVAPLWEQNDGESLQNVPSRMLEFLLLIFLRSETQQSPSPAPQNALRLTAMVGIPLLCELCPMEALISKGDGNLSLLGLMRTVFELLSKFTVEGQGKFSTKESTGVTSAERVLLSALAVSDNGSSKERITLLQDQSFVPAFGVAIATVLLNILACMLELGAPQRKAEEERLLQSLMPSLEALAHVGSIRVAGIDTVEWAEINDAASHILALLGCREQAGPELNVSETEESVNNSLYRAKRDLQSEEAPIRARGVSLLRYMIMADNSLTAEHSPRISVVSEIDKNGTDESTQQEEIFLLLLRAVADCESYVYLAAIHAIALLAASSSSFFRVVMVGIIKGRIFVQRKEEGLLLQQRIKLAESAISVLRRSPATLHSQSATILDLLIHGKSQQEEDASNGESPDAHNLTIEYFEGTKNESDENENEGWQEKKIRLNTGGPLFSNEESALVRSALLNLASEIVALEEPAVTARYCAGLVECASSLLSLANARPILRSAAFLAYNLYSCVYSELEEFVTMAGADCPMTVAIVRANDDALVAQLEQYVAGLDSHNAGPDPAAVARCKEALSTRESCAQAGLFTAAKLAIAKAKHDDQYLVRLLSSKREEKNDLNF